MRKLYVLKSIVDLLWILSTITALVLVALLVGVWFIDFSALDIKVSSLNLIDNSFYSRISLCIIILCYLSLIAALFYFRKVLEQFVRVRIFDEKVISYFTISGNLLLFSGLIAATTTFIYKLTITSKVSLEFGFNENIIVVCMGLFFLVLAQIFTIAKKNKEENELTI